MPRPSFSPLLVLGFLLVSAPAEATHRIVPDEASSTQEALDSIVDTVLVRSTVPYERLLVRRDIVLRGHPDNLSSPFIGNLDIVPPEERSIHAIRVEGLRVARVSIQTGDCQINLLSFTNCRIDSGLSHSYTKDLALRSVRVQGCVLGSGFFVRVPQSFEFRNNDVHGWVGVTSDKEGDAIVQDNRFVRECPECGIGLTIGSTTTANVSRNLFFGYDVGANIVCVDGVVVDNVVENCSDVGIQLGIDRCTLVQNRVRHCGAGVTGRTEESDVIANSVLDCTREGISLTQGSSARMHHNIVGRSGGVGLKVRAEGNGQVVISRNTSFENASSGFVVSGHFWQPQDSLVVANIAYGNAVYGLELDSNAGPSRCNDWYANARGSTLGTEPALDFEVDPAFCDVETDDVHLRAGSPLLLVECGAIGALGVGCADTITTPVRFWFRANRVSDGVRLEWRVASGQTILERSESRPDVWQMLAGEPRHFGDKVTVLDRGALPTRTYRYRLVRVDSEGSGTIEGPIEVGASSGASFSLSVARSMTAGGSSTIEFGLPSEAPIDLVILDLAGRHVALLAHGMESAGTHQARWPTSPGAGTSGVYWVRYRFPGGSKTARLILTR